MSEPEKSIAANGAQALRQHDNAELALLFDQDQADRETFVSETPVDNEAALASMRANDRRRRERVEELLAEGLVQTPQDFYFAAYIYQHGGRLSVEDWIVAHQLAMVAAFLGHEEAKWLCAASFDRVLNGFEHSQCLGTQYFAGDNGRFKLGDCQGLLPDYVRAQFLLAPIAEARDTTNGTNSRLKR